MSAQPVLASVPVLPSPSATAVRMQVEAALERRIPAALTVYGRPEPEMLATRLPEVSVARGALTEICGPTSSGRTTALLALLAAATRKAECCAVVDASDSFHPASAEAAGVELGRLLWVRCTDISKQHPQRKYARLEQALKATDLLLQSGGFGVVAIDLGDLKPAIAQRVPLATWFRFRRAVEHTPTALVVVEQIAHAGAAAGAILQLSAEQQRWREINHSAPTQGRLFTGFEITVERLRTKKPAASVRPRFQTY